ncbi:hypothetical protein [Prochlorothrix hollandica]|uniref:hypothetical protein n=1 Tax=Prochlorothrix hollandica TaxID=1223 RepID=UPI0012B62B8C|nr:hypothetical protein [Prochlorothrix hollandica]
MAAPVVGPEEGRYGGENPTRSQLFQGKMHPVDPALTGDRGAETLLTFPLNSDYSGTRSTEQGDPLPTVPA